MNIISFNKKIKVEMNDLFDCEVDEFQKKAKVIQFTNSSTRLFLTRPVHLETRANAIICILERAGG
jgi:hypothetical protein